MRLRLRIEEGESEDDLASSSELICGECMLCSSCLMGVLAAEVAARRDERRGVTAASMLAVSRDIFEVRIICCTLAKL